LPNYLAMIAGTTFGVHRDTQLPDLQGPTLVDQLEAARLSWDAYMEDVPAPCFKGAASGLYAQKHDPFMYFPRIAQNETRCFKVRPLERMFAELRRRVPAFVWITPNLCHDGHNCPDATVSAWLQLTVPLIMGLPAFGDRGALFITYDEGKTDAGCCRLAAGGRIQTLVLGPGVKRGAVIATPVDHYSLLRTIEDGFGLRRLRHAGCSCTSSMFGAWQG
jgi:hypothetical protein